MDRESIAGEEDEEDGQGASGFQAPSSTVDYTPSGALDCVGFEGLEHRNPRRGAKARLHLQMHNRGPDTATAVTAPVFFASANEDESWPDLPADFWTVFPSGDPAAGSAWKPIGPAKTIAEIRPAEPEVVTWDWDVPNDLGDIVGILAIVTSADDPVFEGVSPSAMPVAVADLVPRVRWNRHRRWCRRLRALRRWKVRKQEALKTDACRAGQLRRGKGQNSRFGGPRRFPSTASRS